jgi:hypothetical protein
MRLTSGTGRRLGTSWASPTEAALLSLLHPPQHLREGDVGEGAEEGVRFELAAGQAGGGEAGQEAGEGSRRGQVRDLPTQAASSRWTLARFPSFLRLHDWP